MIMDMLDGKVARLTKTTSQFGVEFDSLADVVSFWVAPGLPAVLVGAGPARARAAWFGAFLFVICGALRLARFNVLTRRDDRRYFVGLPTPGGRRGGGLDGASCWTGEDAPRWSGWRSRSRPTWWRS